jgi:hypothetical protein
MGCRDFEAIRLSLRKNHAAARQRHFGKATPFRQGNAISEGTAIG